MADWSDWRFSHSIEGSSAADTRYIFKNVKTGEQKIFTGNTLPDEFDRYKKQGR